MQMETGIKSLERHFKVTKFIITPILFILDKDGNMIGEQQLKSMPIYTGNLPDLREVAEKLERKANGFAPPPDQGPSRD